MKNSNFHTNRRLQAVVRFKQSPQHIRDRSGRIANAICTAVTTLDIKTDVQLDIGRAIENDQVNVLKIAEDSKKIFDNRFIYLGALSRSTVNTFNWVHGLDGLPNPIGTAQALYSEDGERWYKYSLIRSIVLLTEEATHSIYARNAQIGDVVRKVEAGVEEPLARQVFREAWSQIGVNPRSALVLGVSAAEVGLRGLIGSLIPDAKWLVDEIQTPPVGKILRKFLPTLPVRARWLDGRPITPPLTLVKRVEEAFELRNKMVHVGASPPSRLELAVTLRAISDLLWIFDIYSGEHWAEKHVSRKVKQNWAPKTS